MRGFSLVELLMALLIMLGVCSALFGLMNPAQAMFAVQAELPDMQQRLRAAADALGRDLLMAGGGGFPPIVPYRRGLESPDAPGTFRSDRVSVLYLSASGPQATLTQPTDGSGVAAVGARPGCPAGDPLCGFRAGMLAVIFDGTGAYDMIGLSGVSNEPPALLHVGSPLSKAYPPGATIAQAEAATYWLQTDVGGHVVQLMKYDGQQTDLPVVDNIAELRFEYYIDALTRLDPESLRDGPWLPDSTFAHRFDADLLRVRRVRATIRVRANQMVLHAPVGDRQMSLEIAPRSQIVLP
ncbi:MAG: prepilin-type N-terminal cleavage/methylation domain-containing protein [Acidobacteria bacterium]|nr:MAG: prepilin-type N-terminal cleavage/methylation domain-containing protein [Acidobacteriota bacterium]